MTQKDSFTLGELSALLDSDLLGESSVPISGIGTLKNSAPGQISFLSNPSYIEQLALTSATAVILAPEHAAKSPVPCLISSAPYVAFAKATALFDRSLNHKAGVAASAVVDPSAKIADDVSIGDHAVIEAGVMIGSGSTIAAHCFVGQNSVVGERCKIHPKVVLYHKVELGNDVVIHSGSVIGADGFGFAFDGEKSIKIHQLGGVSIGNEVEIGAGTTIDRGALENTQIKDGVKIDNQVQIGHNCVIGEHTVICGCVALAGSVTVGKYCIMGGASGAVGHISIADKTQVSAMSLVSQSITEASMYSSGTGHMKTKDWKRAIVRFQQLDSWAKRIKSLEKQLTKKAKGDE